jgi:hypothetical protein
MSCGQGESVREPMNGLAMNQGVGEGGLSRS